MSKYDDWMVEKILKSIDSGNYTVTAICKSVNISTPTWYSWIKDFPDFREKVNQKFNDEISFYKTIVKKIAMDYEENPATALKACIKMLESISPENYSDPSKRNLYDDESNIPTLQYDESEVMHGIDIDNIG